MLDLWRTFLHSVEPRPHSLALVDGETRLTYAAELSYCQSERHTSKLNRAEAIGHGSVL